MCTLIQVLADDPFYTKRKTYILVNLNAVAKIIPIYATENNSELWRCTSDHENAKLVTRELSALNGERYYCGNKKELEKIGIVSDTEPEPGKIGFLQQKGTEKTEIEIA
nr:hypothetical protein [uncultured bacterium]